MKKTESKPEPMLFTKQGVQPSSAENKSNSVFHHLLADGNATYPWTEQFIPLDLETRIAVDTATAAFHLNRQPQTMRFWASSERAGVRPIRINGRLAWPVSEIRRLLGCAPFPKAAKRQESSNTEPSAVAEPITQGKQA